MARHKDVDWYLPEGIPNDQGDKIHSWSSIQCALLMDIRDELKSLNALLQSSNFISKKRVGKKPKRS